MLSGGRTGQNMTPMGTESKPASYDETVYVYKIEKVKEAVAVACVLAIRQYGRPEGLRMSARAKWTPHCPTKFKRKINFRSFGKLLAVDCLRPRSCWSVL